MAEKTSSPSVTEYAPPQLIGWVPAIDQGRPMGIDRPPDTVEVKVVTTREGLAVVALGESAETAAQILESLGIRPDRIRRMLCG